MRIPTHVLLMAVLLATAAPAWAIEVSVLNGAAYATASPADDPITSRSASRGEVGTPGPTASATLGCYYSEERAEHDFCIVDIPVHAGTSNVQIACGYQNVAEGHIRHVCFVATWVDGEQAPTHFLLAEVAGGFVCLAGWHQGFSTIAVICYEPSGSGLCALVRASGIGTSSCFRPEALPNGVCVYESGQPPTCATDPRVEEERGGACAVVDVNGAPLRVACLVP